MASYGYSRGPRGRGGGGAIKVRLLIAAAIILFSVVSYYMSTSKNPITGEHERVAMDVDQEIAMGLQATEEVIRQHRGEIDPRSRHHQRVDRIGEELLRALDKDLQRKGLSNPYREEFEFYLLADDQTVNAFALPGGQVFVTAALYARLDQDTDDELAGVIGHEIGHVLARHGAKRLAKQKLTQGISGAVGVAAGDANSARMAAAVANLVNMQYGRQDELESDRWGVKLMADAGYDPYRLIDVMNVLEDASGGKAPPEFLSTHPKPANRREYIKLVIRETLPELPPPPDQRFERPPSRRQLPAEEPYRQ